MKIVIGTKAWSSWSMRPWLALMRTGCAFEEVLIPLRWDGASAALAAHSPSGLVPVLVDGDLTVCDSLAICEHLNERFPQARLWPADPAARSLARAAAARMHAGFPALRRECPMALGERLTVELSAEAMADVRGVTALWLDMLARFGGPFLAGEWSIADAFFTPVATRFQTYGIDLGDYGDTAGAAAAYAARLLSEPDYRAWEASALADAAKA